MEAVAAMVTPGNILADVGTDHGHVPIALVQRKRIPRAIAMDLRMGPLAHAKENIARCGLTDFIETRLSDGVEALAPGEAGTIVIAGMGGELVIHILMKGEAVCRAAGELILQPQSELAKVRKFLIEHGYRITDENMIYEDGKYYPLMRVTGDHGQSPQQVPTRTQSVPKETLPKESAVLAPPAELAYLYGPCLLASGHPVLMEYLRKEQTQLQAIADQLKKQPVTGKIQKRMTEIAKKKQDNYSAQEYMNGRLIHEPI